MFENSNRRTAHIVCPLPIAVRVQQHVGDLVSVDFSGPPPRSRNTKHALIAMELIARPGEWGIVQRPTSISRASSAAQAIRTGRLTAYPAGEFEAKARTIVKQGGVEHRVYARYVGPKK
ncbi:hypothetical protein ACFV97_18390 [Streptomyces sp. NPDC059913]|uniref:hypothetical protein n=1 Tax=unclassified Streptomyces TaxID=2593676 RepID=UPI003656F562